MRTRLPDSQELPGGGDRAGWRRGKGGGDAARSPAWDGVRASEARTEASRGAGGAGGAERRKRRPDGVSTGPGQALPVSDARVGMASAANAHPPGNNEKSRKGSVLCRTGNRVLPSLGKLRQGEVGPSSGSLCFPCPMHARQPVSPLGPDVGPSSASVGACHLPTAPSAPLTCILFILASESFSVSFPLLKAPGILSPGRNPWAPDPGSLDRGIPPINLGTAQAAGQSRSHPAGQSTAP